MQILRLRSGEFNHATEMRLWISQDGSHHTRDIHRCDRVSLSQAKWEFNPATLADGCACKRQKTVEENGRPHIDDRQAGPCQGGTTVPVQIPFDTYGPDGTPSSLSHSATALKLAPSRILWRISWMMAVCSGRRAIRSPLGPNCPLAASSLVSLR